MVQCPSVPSFDSAAACGEFAAECRAGIYQSTAAGSSNGAAAQSRSTALSSKREQCYGDS